MTASKYSEGAKTVSGNNNPDWVKHKISCKEKNETDILIESVMPETDWKNVIIKEFSSWVYELNDDELLKLINNNELNSIEVPDMYTFYSGLSALKQEIKIQNKINQKSSTNLQNSLNAISEDTMESGLLLKDVLLQKKQRIREARREAEEKILLELIGIREMVINMKQINDGFNENINLSPLLIFVRLLQKYYSIINSKKIKKKYRKELKKEFEKQTVIFRDCKQYLADYEKDIKKQKILFEKKESELNLLLAKIDDVFRRLNVQIIGRVEQKFDPGKMKAIATSKNSGVGSGFVTKIFHHGYMVEDKIIHIAEVQVEQ